MSCSLIDCSFKQLYLLYARTCCSADIKLVFILQQGRHLGADAASAAVHNILEILNQSLGKTSTRQGQHSGQSQTVDQEMARFQFCSHDNDKQQHFLFMIHLNTIIRAVVVVRGYFEVHCVPNKHSHVIQIM